MGQCFADRELQLVRIEGAVEEQRQCLHRGHRADHSRAQLVQAILVVRQEIADAGTVAAEGQAVGRQDQRALGQRRQGAKGSQEIRQGIAIRFRRADRNVRADPGQDLVARDEDTEIGCMETGVFGGMTTPDNNTPDSAADFDLLAIAYGAVVSRQGADPLSVTKI